MVWLQDSILECLHYHTLSIMLFNGISKAYCVQILLCFGPRANAWFITRPRFLTFRLFSVIFSKTFRTRLGLCHPSIGGIFQCVWMHPIVPMGVDFLQCIHGNEHTGTHDVVHDTFVTIAWNVSFHVDKNNYMHFLQPCSIAFINELTLCSLKMTFTP
jgi:hypothetical protein